MRPADEPKLREQSEGVMTTTVVRYQTKPERAEENQKLFEAVVAGATVVGGDR